MIRSMTGFGKAERLAPNKKFSVEIRSLNSKQLDLSIKMPSAYRSLEPEIRTLATKALQRGKVEIFVTAESTAVETSAHINKEQFRAYVRQLSDALTYAGMEASFDAMMQSVLRMPDVVSTPNETVPEEEHAALLAAAADEGVPAPALCQPALSMLNTGALEELLPLCEKEGVGVVPYQLLQGGMLTGKYRRGQEAPAGSRLAEKPEWMKPFTDETYDVIERCAAEAAAEGVTMTQHALRWALAQPGVVSALVGVKREEQIDEAAGAVR